MSGSSTISRRTLVQAMAVGAGAVAVTRGAAAQQPAQRAAPPTTITTPPRDFGPTGATASAEDPLRRSVLAHGYL